MIGVYIISLKESQRRLDTEKLVSESNEKFKGRCVFQIFDAISPKHEDFEKFIQELYDAQSMLKSDWYHSDWCRGELLPQEFGCYLSHYLLWKECVKLNQPVVILEDDVALESNFMQALEDCLKSPFDFVKLFGWYWNFHKTNLHTLPLERDAVESVGETPIEDHAKTKEAEVPIENHEVTPPPNPTQDMQQDPKGLSEPCKIAPQKISFNQVVFKKIKRKLNHFIGNILARTEVYKKLTGKYDELTGKYESLLAKEANIKETFWERRADSEKEVFFLEHFYLTSVYVASTAGYYITPKGAKTFIEATERFKIIEPVDMFINNPTYHDVATLTYLPLPVSLNKHCKISTIQNLKKSDISLSGPKKSYLDNLLYDQLNTRKCLKAFHKYSRRYAPLKTPKEV
ncbi:glycosyltransferase family 25 protein [Helicobacter pylori]|uniref:glycosyltransferase family 25 protein n=1 Tax=Helicobacter pylori TaxID=210 RepID=UPI0029282D32|nr:glycosyltransferase family 25 protein [Helicobacter pylori]MDU9766690.1 glycosyltransferase family 25 protein [Helicobacter pylori]